MMKVSHLLSLLVGLLGTAYAESPPDHGDRPSDITDCTLDISGVPEQPICPGDCFTITAHFTTEASPPMNRLAVYGDHPDLTAVVINGVANPYSLPELMDEDLEDPPYFQGEEQTIDVEICIQQGAAEPVNFAFYYYQAGPECLAGPLSEDCCQDIQPFTVTVQDIRDYTDLQLTVRDPTATVPADVICNGDAVHFDLSNLPAPGEVTWQYFDATTAPEWVDIAADIPFSASSYSFLVLPGHPALSFDCATSTAGYLDRSYRAKVSVATGDQPCEYFSTEYPLRICCPLSSGSLDIGVFEATMDDVPIDFSQGICAGAYPEIKLQVNLLSTHPFVVEPGEFVSIEWELNGELRTEFADQTSIEYTQSLGNEDVQLSVTIYNCDDKPLTLSECIYVEAKPVCGTITADAYEICPGEDNVLYATGFEDCVIHWEYSYDGSDWIALGSVSNTLQYTNPLIETDATTIYYRIRCEPEPSDSACNPDPETAICDACISDPIAITEIQPPEVPILADCASEPVCSGDVVSLLVSNPQPGVGYTWYVDGLPVGTGPDLTYPLEDDICYRVEASNDCFSIASATCCLATCAVVAVISCPLPPNECAFLGAPIELTAAGSETTCDPADLSYLWTWTDAAGSHSETTETITATPDPGGTTYTLTVTNESGCADTAVLSVVPCT